MRFFSDCEIAAKLIIPSIRAGVAIVLLERGYTLSSVGRLLGLSTAAVHHYKRRKRGFLLVDRLLEDREYRSRLERIADMMIEGIGNPYIEERVSQEICRLCKRFREREQIASVYGKGALIQG